jgi:hypothetical protein
VDNFNNIKKQKIRSAFGALFVAGEEMICASRPYLTSRLSRGAADAAAQLNIGEAFASLWQRLPK